MKHWFLGLSLALGLLLSLPTVDVRASDSDGSSDSGSNGGRTGAPELDSTIAGSAMVLLLGGVAYLASRRRDQNSA